MISDATKPVAHGGRYERQLRREARIVRDIHHPRIVALHDVVVEQGESWLVLEYVPLWIRRKAESRSGGRKLPRSCRPDNRRGKLNASFRSS
jgi:hypothetical protein